MGSITVVEPLYSSLNIRKAYSATWRHLKVVEAVTRFAFWSRRVSLLLGKY